MEFSRYAEIVQRAWDELPHHYENIYLDFFTIMPNHIHGIIFINVAGSGGSVEDKLKSMNPAEFPYRNPHTPLETRPYDGNLHGLPEIIRAFKSFSARRINNMRGRTGQPVWQRNYYDRIIRNQRELDSIHAYIIDNPRRWPEDQEYRL